MCVCVCVCVFRAIISGYRVAQDRTEIRPRGK